MCNGFLFVVAVVWLLCSHDRNDCGNQNGCQNQGVNNGCGCGCDNDYDDDRYDEGCGCGCDGNYNRVNVIRSGNNGCGCH